jgi:hypothetical protein
MPEYDTAVLELGARLVQALAWDADPLFSKIRVEHVEDVPEHSAPPEAAHGATSQLLVATRFVEPFADVLSGNVEGWAGMIAAAAEEVGDQIGRQFVAFLEKVTEESGQVVDARGRRMSADLVLEALERMSIDFDDEGRAKMPTIFCHPSAIKGLEPPTEEQKARFEKIMEGKKSEFLARRRVRKLD